MSEHTPTLIMMSWGSKYKAQTGDQGLTAFQTLANDKFDRDCISRAVATWNAFEDPAGRKIATEDIAEGAVFQLRDALSALMRRAGVLSIMDDDEREQYQAILSNLKVQGPET